MGGGFLITRFEIECTEAFVLIIDTYNLSIYPNQELSRVVKNYKNWMWRGGDSNSRYISINYMY